MTAGTARPLWRCPECGRSFANTNQAHACQMTMVDEYLADKTELAVSIYETIVSVLELYGPTSWGHTVRLHRPDEVDEAVRGWLAQALRRGNQETLNPSHEVEPLTGHQLEVFWTGFRGKVTVDGIRVPGYIAEALALLDDIIAKINGVDYTVAMVTVEDHVYLPVDPEASLGLGDEADVFLKTAA